MSVVVEIPAPRVALRQAIIATGEPAWKIGLRAGLSATVLSHISTGRRAPQVDEAQRLAEVLGVDVAELFPEEEGL